MALSFRERRLLAAAGLVALILILFSWWRQGPVLPRPAPPPAVQAPPPVAAPATAPAPAPDLSGLRLHGLLVSGAIIGFADGRQRLVLIGREALPGLMLRRIEQSHAVLASAGGEARLGFDGPAVAAPAAPPGELAGREDALRYRLGLAPRRLGGRVTGFTVRRGADLPALGRAGIRPGDTILRVGGSELDEERMLELAWTIANSPRLEFEVERHGRRIRMTLGDR